MPYPTVLSLAGYLVDAFVRADLYDAARAIGIAMSYDRIVEYTLAELDPEVLPNAPLDAKTPEVHADLGWWIEHMFVSEGGLAV